MPKRDNVSTLTHIDDAVQQEQPKQCRTIWGDYISLDVTLDNLLVSAFVCRTCSREPLLGRRVYLGSRLIRGALDT